MAKPVNIYGSVQSNITHFFDYKIPLTRKNIRNPSLSAWARASSQVQGIYSRYFSFFWKFSFFFKIWTQKSFRTEMQLQRGAKQRMSVPFERKPSRRYSRRSTFRSARGQATRQVSGDDHFRRYIPAEGPSAAPPDVKYKPIGQLGQRHHEKSRKLPKRDESGSTTGSRGRPESPSVSWSTSIVLLLRIWSKTAIRNIQIIMYCLWRDCKLSFYAKRSNLFAFSF